MIQCQESSYKKNMEYKIQSIVFPTEVKHQQCRKLFYRGDLGYVDRENRSLSLGYGMTCDFVTYLNACSYRKWRRYTRAGKLNLILDIEGPVSICYLGYHLDSDNVTRTEFDIVKNEKTERRAIRFSFPDNDEMMDGAEISALGKVTIYGGYYTVDCTEEDLNTVNLSIATTTMKKEAFIKRNVQLLKDEILDSEDDIRDHLFIHVVDNGRTLTEDDINGRHVYLHPNPNAGGSGGYARGMMESLHQKEAEITNVLLMDDDVQVLPESIKRTYCMLRLMKAEYQERFISGAMLYFEKPNQQHEDIGTVTDIGFFQSKKLQWNHNLLEDNLRNEDEYAIAANEYAAWWYCCIPKKTIEEKGLPLPLFIRGDDVEYGLRCKPGFITLNGICVWHMGFTNKYNAAMNVYQEVRNELIDQACSGVMKDVNLYRFWYVKRYRASILQFNYGQAELALRAMEDFLKGPKFLMEDRGESIVKENVKLNENMQELKEYVQYGNVFNDNPYEEPPRTFFDKWIFRLTFNGQRLWPESWLRKEPVMVGYDDSYQPEKITLRSHIFAVNPRNHTANLRVIDRQKFRELNKRAHKLMSEYKNNHTKIEEEYRKAFPYLTSEKFWKEYLGLDTKNAEN